nr:DUF2778 domain-containing protein [Klebsiella variicola]
MCRCYLSRANIDGFTRVISASGVRAGVIAKCFKINKSRANTNRFITSCRELRRGNSDWFALWRDDRGIDDETWVEGVKRGNFRLHPGTVSGGCIIIAHNSDFAMIRNALMNTSLVQVPCMRSLMARGWVEVVASGSNNACP